jgi:hypothetical protein
MTMDVPQLIAAERVGGELVITFDNGKFGLYSAALLYATLPQAQEIPDEPEFDEEGVDTTV